MIIIFFMCIVAMLIVCVCVLSISLVKQANSFKKERTDYLNRLMARSSSEYINLRKNTQGREETNDNEVIDPIGGDRNRNPFNGIIN